MKTYTTIQGDTFDWIAKRLYGDEKRMDALIAANPRLVGSVVFPAGMVVNLPDLPASSVAFGTPPPWRNR